MSSVSMDKMKLVSVKVQQAKIAQVTEHWKWKGGDGESWLGKTELWKQKENVSEEKSKQDCSEIWHTERGIERLPATITSAGFCLLRLPDVNKFDRLWGDSRFTFWLYLEWFPLRQPAFENIFKISNHFSKSNWFSPDPHLHITKPKNPDPT